MKTVFLAPNYHTAESAAREMGIVGRDWRDAIVVTDDHDALRLSGISDYRVVEVMFARGIARGVPQAVRAAVRARASTDRVEWLEHWLV